MPIALRALAGGTVPLALLLTGGAAAAQAVREVPAAAPQDKAGGGSYPAAAAGDGAVPGGYSLSRWAEDWRAMRDPTIRWTG